MEVILVCSTAGEVERLTVLCLDVVVVSDLQARAVPGRHLQGADLVNIHTGPSLRVTVAVGLLYLYSQTFLLTFGPGEEVVVVAATAAPVKLLTGG